MPRPREVDDTRHRHQRHYHHKKAKPYVELPPITVAAKTRPPIEAESQSDYSSRSSSASSQSSSQSSVDDTASRSEEDVRPSTTAQVDAAFDLLLRKSNFFGKLHDIICAVMEETSDGHFREDVDNEGDVESDNDDASASDIGSRRVNEIGLRLLRLYHSRHDDSNKLINELLAHPPKPQPRIINDAPVPKQTSAVLRADKIKSIKSKHKTPHSRVDDRTSSMIIARNMRAAEIEAVVAAEKEKRQRELKLEEEMQAQKLLILQQQQQLEQLAAAVSKGLPMIKLTTQEATTKSETHHEEAPVDVVETPLSPAGAPSDQSTAGKRTARDLAGGSPETGYDEAFEDDDKWANDQAETETQEQEQEAADDQDDDFEADVQYVKADDHDEVKEDVIVQPQTSPPSPPPELKTTDDELAASLPAPILSSRSAPQHQTHAKTHSHIKLPLQLHFDEDFGRTLTSLTQRKAKATNNDKQSASLTARQSSKTPRKPPPHHAEQTVASARKQVKRFPLPIVPTVVPLVTTLHDNHTRSETTLIRKRHGKPMRSATLRSPGGRLSLVPEDPAMPQRALIPKIKHSPPAPSPPPPPLPPSPAVLLHKRDGSETISLVAGIREMMATIPSRVSDRLVQHTSPLQGLSQRIALSSARSTEPPRPLYVPPPEVNSTRSPPPELLKLRNDDDEENAQSQRSQRSQKSQNSQRSQPSQRSQQSQRTTPSQADDVKNSSLPMSPSSNGISSRKATAQTNKSNINSARSTASASRTQKPAASATISSDALPPTDTRHTRTMTVDKFKYNRTKKPLTKYTSHGSAKG